MNLAKIVVPTELLTKTDPLTDDEQRLLANTHQDSAGLLRNVPFDGPVVETIGQMDERWDGSGPRGLSGEAILRPARSWPWPTPSSP